MSSWETVGVVGVDAGMCWLGDPCYILHKDKDDVQKELGKTWDEFCKILWSKEDEGKETYHNSAQFNYNMGHAGLGVVVHTGYGDGTYPVEVKKNEEGRITQVRIVFIDEEDELRWKDYESLPEDI